MINESDRQRLPLRLVTLSQPRLRDSRLSRFKGHLFILNLVILIFPAWQNDWSSILLKNPFSSPQKSSFCCSRLLMTLLILSRGSLISRSPSYFPISSLGQGLETIPYSSRKKIFIFSVWGKIVLKNGDFFFLKTRLHTIQNTKRFRNIFL